MTAAHLRDFSAGDKGRIVGFSGGDRGYRERLLAMGLTPNTDFTVRRVAPLGDPIELWVRGASVSLRRDEAELLKVERT
jgi:Fe2+ transport system protein FeoA